MPARFRQPKRRGEWAEMKFMVRAAEAGFTVSKPYGDSALYDFIVDAGGVLSRVQVKSVSVAQRDAYRICSGSGHRSKTAYTPSDLDFLAAYVIPHDAWYIIPVAAFTPVKTLRLRPHHPSRRRFELYREAWRLLHFSIPVTRSPAPSTSYPPALSPRPTSGSPPARAG